MHFKELFKIGRKGDHTDGHDLLTPEDLHCRSEELGAALRANYYRAAQEGKVQLPDAELLFRLMNMVEIILDNNKRGRKGFDCADPEWSRASELEVFKSVRHGLERYLDWHVTMPLSSDEQMAEDYTQYVRDELIEHARRRYGKLVSKDDAGADIITDEDVAWLRRFGMLPE